MKRILVVDDEPRELVALKRLLADAGQDWDTAFAESGRAALSLLEQSRFDMVVSDLSMPEMDGTELLAEVAKKHPDTIRIILSGHAAHSSVLKLVGPAHQYLAKPIDPEAFLESLARSFVFQSLLENKQLLQLVTQAQFLPGLPSLCLEMLKELRKVDPSVPTLARLISQDPAVCTKLLQIVNSAFFGLPQLISTPVDAILHLGVEMVKNVVLSLQLYNSFQSLKLAPIILERVWNHSWKTGLLARRIAESENFLIRDHAFIAGLLHDIGKLMLAGGLPERYSEVKNLATTQRKQIVEAERELLGVTHAEVGAYLLGLWGFPAAIVEAVVLHHFPKPLPNHAFSLVTAVHVANALAHEREDAPGPVRRAQVDLVYLASIGMQNRLGFWRESTNERALKEAV